MGKIGLVANPKTERITMSSTTHASETTETDAVEAVVHAMPIVLPLVGAVLMFLLAFIAVSMA